MCKSESAWRVDHSRSSEAECDDSNVTGSIETFRLYSTPHPLPAQPVHSPSLYMCTRSICIVKQTSDLFFSLQVDPQEDKKKPKVGRAKRRMQYNRRVNVAPVFGKRKGPNSNS